MPSIQIDPHTGKQYYLITNVAAKAEAETDLHAKSWKLPYSIDDSDLTFDGKPLNMLYEENQNRWIAEHDVSASREKSHQEKSHSSRGRSRQSKK